MDRETFKKIVDARFQRCQEMLTSKGNGYSRNGDVFHNFRFASMVTGCTLEKALWGMWVKHIASVFDIINDVPDKIPEKEVLAEKIGDLINYALMLEGMIEERRIEQQTKNK